MASCDRCKKEVGDYSNLNKVKYTSGKIYNICVFCYKELSNIVGNIKGDT